MAGSKKNGRNANDSVSRGGRSNDGGDSASTGRRLRIKPLSTVGDRGKPSKSVAKDLQRVSNLIEDERHLVANELYNDCKERMKQLRQLKSEEAAKGKEKKKSHWMQQNKTKGSLPSFNEEDFEAALDLLKKNKNEFARLEKLIPLFHNCRDNMGDSEEWTVAQTLFGVTTSYRREDDGSLSMKLEGELVGTPLFEQVCVLREIDLHSHWAPFVTSSLTIAHLDKLDTIGWFMVGLPNFGLARDGCFRAVGCDCVEEDQSVLIVGRGVNDRPPEATVDEGTAFLSDDPELKALDIPEVPNRMGSGRLTIRTFEAKIQVMGPDHCHTSILANIDPNLAFIPQALLEFIMKKMCGFLLIKLQSAAKKVGKDPVRNVHAQRMRDESAFYRDWLLPKFQNIAALRGWDIPPLAAFNLSAAQQVEAEKLVQKRSGDVHTFSYFDGDENSTDGGVPNMYHSKLSEDDDDNSDISSLSGTSQSIWKNNPIANYLREVEQKTQTRKDKAAQDTRRKVAARLRPRPLPNDKKERLKELKAHKERKLRSRGYSTDGSLAPVDENDTVVTGGTSRSVPYSPISAALDGHGYWSRTWVVSGLVLMLFFLLHGDRFLPSFSSLGDEHETLSTILQDAITVIYLVACGVVHFLLCDVELIYTFEAFEMGMKTGEQVKTFYRGKVRVAVAAASGMLVLLSVAKALLLACLKASMVWLFVAFEHCMNTYVYINKDPTYGVVELESAPVDGNATLVNATIISKVAGVLYGGYSMFMGLMHVVFDWQMKVFVRSNILGRSIESLITGIYNAWYGLLTGIGRTFYSLAHSSDVQDSPGYSWRDDAISTARVLLTYTAVFLLAVLAFLNMLSKSYRHKTPGADSPDYATITTPGNSESDHASLASGSNGLLTKRAVDPNKSVDATARRRRKFGRKRNKEDDDSM